LGSDFLDHILWVLAHVVGIVVGVGCDVMLQGCSVDVVWCDCQVVVVALLLLLLLLLLLVVMLHCMYVLLWSHCL